MIFKKIVKLLLPKLLIKFIRKFLTSFNLLKYKKKTNKEIFKEIYFNKLWSPEDKKKDYEFYSGTGSHVEDFSETYLIKIKEFLQTFTKKPNVVDLGCGDFNIGSKLRKYCNNYIAVDIFEEIINKNKITYNNFDVDFRVLDITNDNLPESDVCFLRQVLQHLSNENIEKFLRQIKGKYKFLVLTEHLPDIKNFTPNLDIITGPEIRLYKNSGVVLTEKPFNLKPINEKNICNTSSLKISGFEGTINTIIYKLKE